MSHPDSPSKLRSFAAFFGVSGDRGPLSPDNGAQSYMTVPSHTELGGFTPNSAVPMQQTMSNTSSNHPSSSDFNMSPNNAFFDTSISSPDSSHGFSSGTTPGYDQEIPFDVSTPMPEGDSQMNMFVDQSMFSDSHQSSTLHAPHFTQSSAFFPSPAMTNASVSNTQVRGGGMTFQSQSDVPPLNVDISKNSSSSPPFDTVSSPNITVDDHDADQAGRRLKKRSPDEEPSLNRVLPSVSEAPGHADGEIPSLKDQEAMAIETENHMKVFRWLSGDGSGYLNTTAASGPNRIRSRSVGHLDGEAATVKPKDANASTTAGDFKFESAGEYPFQDGTPRADGDVLFDDSEEEENSEAGTPSDEEGLPDTLIEEHDLIDNDIVPPRHVDSIQKMTEEEEMALVDHDAHPNAFYRPAPWHDPPKPILTHNVREGLTRFQPQSSNAAIERWRKANENIETASRVATFGTMRSRRYSIGEMDGLFKRMSFGRDDENLNVVRRPNANSDRKPSLFEVKNVLKRFSSAGHDHKPTALTALQNFAERASSTSKDNRPQRKESQKGGSKGGRDRSPLISLTRKLSKKRKQSDTDSKDTASAFAGIGTFGMGIGGEGAAEAASSINPMSPQSRRNGSLSSSRFGVPGFSSLGSPIDTRQQSLSVPPFEHEEVSDEDAEADADAPHDPTPAPPQLKIPVDKIIPNRSGFAKHCTQLNPQLQQKLVERIAIEQVKRFRKLQENFMKHHGIIQGVGHCSNGNQCGAIANQNKDNNSLGQDALDHNNTSSVYAMQAPQAGEYDSEDEDVPNTDGRVTSTQFPPGVPMPPVNRLPNEFECTLCFKVKKFTKPSDWTKHVHEDVQPFTCTFPDCTEPKSFKRKADWVRHENEKHRHLEWWTCNLPDCSHTCYRKDNFVQHLVREHKNPKLKVKPTKGTTGRAAKKGGKDGEDDEANKLWDIVAACYHETAAKPQSEPCRFCGLRLQSWKKLTVHLARHMEAISLPVIELVGEDAVLSPASTRRGGGNSTNATPITPFNPMAAAFSNSLVSPIVSNLQTMYVDPNSNIYSPTRTTQQQQGYPTPHVTPQRNNGVTLENRAAYGNTVDPSLALHQAQQYASMQPIQTDLNLFIDQLAQAQVHQQQQHVQQHQHQPQNQQSHAGNYDIHGGQMPYGVDGSLLYGNPGTLGHVPPGLSMENNPQYTGWPNHGVQGEDETERYMNWPQAQNHQPY